MLKLRLVLGVLCIVALSTFFSFTQNTVYAKSNEAYSWNSYDSIYASLGQYSKISPEGDRLTFTQDANNPLLFTSVVTTEKCNTTINLNISSSNASVGRISHKGNCPDANTLDQDVRINNSMKAFAMIESEELEIKNLYINASCSASSDKTQAISNDTNCAKTAEDKFSQEQTKCLESNNYKSNLTKSNSYLDCLSTSLNVDRPSSDNKDENKDSPSQRSCQIPGIGWMICQMTEFIARLTDHTFALLQPFLDIEPLKKEVSTDQDSITYNAWRSIRDVSNVLLGIGFIAIIFSHLSSIGIQTYHIKRSLPRLIVASILINLSFFVCSALIDVSNIIGKTMQDTSKIFPTMIKSQSSVFSNWEDTATTITSITPVDNDFNKKSSGITDSENTDQTNQENQKQTQQNKTETYSSDLEDTSMNINGVVITGSAVLFANLSILLPIMVFALFAMFTALMVLLFRQTLVIILVIIAPLAFVSMVLPGTERWYKKWQSTFIQLLMLYPIIAILYTGSQIASDAIRDSASQNGHTLIAIFSLGIQVIPLFVTPLILKFSGGAINQFAGAVRGVSKAPRRLAMDRANEFHQDRKELVSARRRNGRIFGGRLKIPGGEKIGQFLPSNIANSFKTGRRIRKAGIENSKKQYMYQNMDNFLSGVTDTDTVAGMKAEYASKVLDIDTRTVTAEQNVLEHKGISRPELMNMSLTGKDSSGQKISEHQQRAAVRMILANATPQEANQLLVAGGSGNLPESVSREIVAGARKAGVSGQSFEVSQTVLEGVYGSNQNMDQAMTSAIETRRLAPANAPLQAPETIKRARNALNSDAVSPEAKNDFVKTIAKGVVSDNAGSANPQTIQEMSILLNEAVDNGHDFSEIASIFSAGENKNYKDNAYKSFLTERIKKGKLDIKDLVKSKDFVNEVAKNPSLSKHIFKESIKAVENGKQFDAYDVESLNFYGSMIPRDLIGLDQEDRDGIKKFVGSILDNSSKVKDTQEKAIVYKVVHYYNNLVKPEDRV